MALFGTAALAIWMYYDYSSAMKAKKKAFTTNVNTFNQNTPFLLIARVEIKPGKVQEYLKLAKDVDTAVKDSEPGMLHHTFDQDPNNKQIFVWSEVYQNDAAFLKHLSNPPVGKYLELGGPLQANFEVEVYGTVGAECKKAMEATKLPLKIFNSEFGYTRIQ